MKIKLLLISMVFTFAISNILYCQTDTKVKTLKKSEKTSKENNEDYGPGVMVDSDMEITPSANTQKTKSFSKKGKKENMINGEMETENSSSFKKYQFKDFEINIPDICEVKINDDKTSATIGGGNNSECFFEGKLSQINKKRKINYLVKKYKAGCKLQKAKTIMKKWIKNPSVEGYFMKKQSY